MDALASDPAQAATLPPELRATLLAKALAVVRALAAAPTPVNGPAPTAPATDRVVRIKEAARLLGTSTDHPTRDTSFVDPRGDDPTREPSTVDRDPWKWKHGPVQR